MIILIDHLPLWWRIALFAPQVALMVVFFEMTLGRMFGGDR